MNGRSEPSRRVTLAEMSALVLRPTLEFPYTRRCLVEPPLLGPILQAAKRLQIAALAAVAEATLQSKLDPSNGVRIWRLAEMYDLDALAD